MSSAGSAGEVPPEVQAFADLLHVDIVDTPMKLLPPGYRRPVWLIPVEDESTGEIVGILNAYPTYDVSRYRIITIVNKLGRPVNVIVFKEEAERVGTHIPREEEVKKAVEEAAKNAPEPPPKPAGKAAPQADWNMLQQLANRLQSWVTQMKRQVENKNTIGVYTYLKSIIEFVGDAGKKLAQNVPQLAPRPKPEKALLTQEEYERLWDEFSRALKKAGADPEEWRARFDELIAWDMPFGDNEYIVMDEARNIALQQRLQKKYIKKLPQRPTRFSWRYVGWGIGSISVYVELLKNAIVDKNVVQADDAMKNIVSVAEKLKEMFEMLPDVRDFLNK